MSFLELRAVTKRYGATMALCDIDLDLAPGSRTAVVGPSGSGKTTLLRLIAGFEAPDEGRIVLDGVLLADGPRSMAAHRRGIGIVAQEGALFPHLSIADNIGYGLPRHDAGRDARIRDLMAMTGLDASLLPRRPDQISGGQQQRVALARALARRPRLMLLDEPFSALDTGLRADTRKAVSELLAVTGITTVLVTHDQAEALSFADQVAVMRRGRLPQAGTPRDLYLAPIDPMIAAFLGEAIIMPAEIVDGQALCALGRLPVGDLPDRRSARVMLRPEQIRLEPADSTDCAGSGRGALGRITSVDFAGAFCVVEVQLLGEGASSDQNALLRLPTSTFEAPAKGSVVAIAVRGRVHVFEDQDKAGRNPAAPA